MPFPNNSLTASDAARLEAIRPALARAGRIARRLFDAPVGDAVIVIGDVVWRGADRDEQNADDEAVRELALGQDGELWIADAREDARWARHPLVERPDGVRFYAQASITQHDGRRIGAVRVLDNRPRPYDPELATILQDLAGGVSDAWNRIAADLSRELWNLFEQAPNIAAVLAGSELLVRGANRRCRDVLGDEIVGRPLRERLQSFGAVLELIDQVLRTGESAARRVLRAGPAGGPGPGSPPLDMDIAVHPLRGVDGQVWGVLWLAADVAGEAAALAELKTREAELREVVAANQAILDNSTDVICTFDAEGRFTQVNRHVQKVWGYAPEELLGRPYIDFVHPDDVERTVDAEAALRTASGAIGTSNRYRRKDGEYVPMMWSCAWVEDLQRGFAVARDMSEQIASEARLRNLHKMEAVGRLTGGVAHDFNNLLTVLMSGAEALVLDLTPGSSHREIAELMLQATQRGAELVERLLAFARQQPLEPQIVDCGQLVLRSLPLLRRTTGERVTLDTTGVVEGTYCRLDETQLESALLNLCLNARDATPGTGEIRIRVEPTTAPRDGASEVRLVVEDDGVGMDPDTLQKATEPFFSTKPAGQGTGLGLSMIYGFVQQSGGRLSISSAPGKGARVEIVFPALLSPSSTDSPPEQEGHHRSVARVLLVEDDHLVRSQTRRQLVSLGYDVRDASGGAEALELLREGFQPDVLMTDVVMPKMNGREVAKAVRRMSQRVRTLYCTGYGDTVLGEDLSESNAPVLRKPYRIAQLAEALSTLLGEPAAP